METLRPLEPGQFHAVKFYKDADSLADIVCSFVASGLMQGEPAVIIATLDHTSVFMNCLSAKGVNVGAVVSEGLLTLLDADTTLAEFMRAGVPMPQRFMDTLTPILTTIAARFPGAPIRAYGEMVDVLWKRDETAAALRVEGLWNDLARSHRFGLLCGYAMGHFYKGSATDDICAVHSHLVTETGARIGLS